MNYLAHILLSGEDEKIIIGNFIGDFVKGGRHKDYENRIQQGILLHRFIDDFTDNHPKVKNDVKLIKNHIGRYAPIAIDIFYDHLIAKSWESYNNQNLIDFSENFYQTAQEYKSIMPERCQFMLNYMKRDNWLLRYKDIEGVSRSLYGLSKRTKYDSRLEEAINYLISHQVEIANGFELFFEELINQCKTYLNGKA